MTAAQNSRSYWMDWIDEPLVYTSGFLFYYLEKGEEKHERKCRNSSIAKGK